MFDSSIQPGGLEEAGHILHSTGKAFDFQGLAIKMLLELYALKLGEDPNNYLETLR